jgi:hypothetical protein
MTAMPTNNIQQGRELAKQAMVASLMRNQGMDKIMATIHADKILAETAPAAPGPMDTLQAQENYAFKPPVPAPQMPAVEGSAQVAGSMGPPQGAPEAPAAGSQSIYDRLGPEGMGALLKQRGLDRQMAYAESLRDKAGPEGMGFGNSTGGSTFVAANPLSHLASGVEKYRAKKDIKRLEGVEQQGLKTVIDMLRGKKDPVPGAGRVM